MCVCGARARKPVNLVHACVRACVRVCVCVCVCVCVYVCVGACTETCEHLSVSRYARVCVYVCVGACMETCEHLWVSGYTAILIYTRSLHVRSFTLLCITVAEWYFQCAIVLSQFVGIVFCTDLN